MQVDKEEYMSEMNEQTGNIVIGTDVSIKGVLNVPNRAVVNGAIDGEITARELIVGQTGRIIGNAKTERADVYGEVHQTLVVSQALVLRSTGKLVGVINYSEIEIEKGGLVEGKLTQQAPPPASHPPVSNPPASSEPKHEESSAPAEAE
jgi:cytoskeletal protein CcmA (bactofilin family)